MSVWLILLYVLAGKPEVYIEKVDRPEACEERMGAKVAEVGVRGGEVVFEGSGCLLVPEKPEI